MILLLPNIRSSHNVGTIFRTAEAFGIQQIILSGYTPAPIDRFGRARADIAKAALGAEKILDWKSVEDIEKYLKEKKAEGFVVVSLEQEKRSVLLADFKKNSLDIEKTILVVGNEVEGVDVEIRNLTDVFLEIPMQGKKESLNVAIATGIMLWELAGK
jgi:tRNA G18 (ribose-2'-O)-methylase SpoU